MLVYISGTLPILSQLFPLTKTLDTQAAVAANHPHACYRAVRHHARNHRQSDDHDTT